MGSWSPFSIISSPTELGGAAPFVLPDHPDSALLAQCERFIVLQAEYSRLSKATDVLDDTPVTPEMAALEAEFTAIREEERILGDALVNAAPSTLKGVRAKARATLAYVGGNNPVSLGARLQESALEDLGGDALEGGRLDQA